jgi:DNA-binding SARP family transcriptional activator
MTLRVHLLGGVRISDRGRPEVRLTHTLQLLLAYLLLERRRTHPRDALAGLLWADFPEERARACLNTALWRLRCALEPPGTRRGAYLVTTAVGDVGFNSSSDHWLDVAVLERDLSRVLGIPPERLTPDDAHRLELVLRLYTGDLLEGCFDDWALRERGRLAALYVRGLEHAMRYHRRRGNAQRSIDYADQILRRDGIREDIHRELMELYDAAGERARAIRQYADCRNDLGRELGIFPGPETQALFRRLLDEAGGDGSVAPPLDGDALAGLTHAMGELTGAAERLRRARADLERLLGRLQAQAGAVVSGPRDRRENEVREAL